MTLQLFFQKLKGGKGSGNWGHAGRKGKLGGSGSSKTQQFVKAESRLNSIAKPTHEELSKHYNLSKNCPDCEGIENYTTSSHKPINNNLRGTLRYSEFITSGLNEKTKKIDSELNGLPRLNKEIKVKRAVSGLDFVKSLKEGSEFKDKGYTSTSVKLDKVWVKNQILLDIIVPKGSKGAYIEDITENKGEFEFLLPRNSKFRILRNDHSENRNPGKEKVILEYLGSEE